MRQTADQVQAALSPLHDLLVAIGTPELGELAAGVDRSVVAGYADAYIVGLQATHLIIGVATVIGGLVAGWLIGRRDPLSTVWEHQDERVPAAT